MTSFTNKIRRLYRIDWQQSCVSLSVGYYRLCIVYGPLGVCMLFECFHIMSSDLSEPAMGVEEALQ